MIEIIFIIVVFILFIISILSNRVWYRKSVEQERIWSELTRNMIREWNNDVKELKLKVANLENFITNENGEVIENDSNL